MSLAERRAALQRAVGNSSHMRIAVILALSFALFAVASTLYLFLLAGRAIDLLTARKVDFSTLTGLLPQMAFAAGFAALCQWLTSVLSGHISFRAAADLRWYAFERFSYDVTSDVDTLASGLQAGFAQLLPRALTMLGALFLMLCISPGTTMAVVLVTAASLFAMPFLSRRILGTSQLLSAEHDEQTEFINEAIVGRKAIHAYGREYARLEQFDEINGRLEELTLRTAFLASLTKSCSRSVRFLIFICALSLGALSAVTSFITLGQLACFLSCTLWYIIVLNEITDTAAQLRNAADCAGHVFELIDESQPKDADDMNREDAKSWKPWLKSGTIRENIALARPEASYEEVVAAAKTARAHSFIRRMPGGYDATIGENGSELSEEQEQLLCEAREILQLSALLRSA